MIKYEYDNYCFKSNHLTLIFIINHNFNIIEYKRIEPLHNAHNSNDLPNDI